MKKHSLKKTTLLIFAALLSFNAFAQDEAPKKETKRIKFYGFVRNFYIFDNRVNFSSVAGLVNKEPKDEVMNALGEDLNENNSSSILALSSRLGMDITGPDVLNATSSGKIEADFAGYSTYNYIFRLRQAYMKLNWDKQNNKHSILLGQTWHPLAVDVVPEVLGMATGAPFNPLNRSPQLQYNYAYKSLWAEAAAIYQLQYTSPGPDGNQASYATNSNIPELYAAIGYKKNGFKAGISAGFLSIKPCITREYTTTINNATGVPTDSTFKRKVNERANGFTYAAFIGYTKGLWSLKVKTIYGENTGHLNMLGGYGVTEENSDGSYEYSPITISSSWLNLSYGKKYKINLFAGYYKNLGSRDDFLDTNKLLYERDCNNIDQMYRIAPTVSYNLKHFNFGLEYELNIVDYGTVQKDGTVNDTHSVIGHRICSMVKYNF